MNKEFYAIEYDFYAATFKHRDKYLLTLHELRFKENYNKGYLEASRIYRLEIATALESRAEAISSARQG